MSRRQAICYVVIAGVVTLALLVLLAIYYVWLMLFAVLLLVTILVIVLHFWPHFFDILRRPPKPDMMALLGKSAARPAPQYTPNLILVADNLVSAEQIAIDKPVFKLGRGEQCDYRVAGVSEVSRVHATIRYDAKTAASYITDNNSHNGTFVNGIKLTPDKPTRVSDGDYIQLGTLRFTAQIAHY